MNFRVSCSATAQQAFNEALAALHSFWYAQAAKEFLAIAEREPDCAMAHWGYAMSQWTQLWAPPRQDALDAGLASLRRADAVVAQFRKAVLAVLYNGLLGTGFAYILWFAIIERLSTATASLGSLSTPVVGITSSMLMLGERPTTEDVIGFALIFAAAACVLTQPAQRTVAQAP